jgi:hypothetical protein
VLIGHTPPLPKTIDGFFSETDCVDGYTHAVLSITRYYGPCYERGPWPEIAAYLLELLADKDVEAILYGGDNGVHQEEVTFEWLTEVNLHYINAGRRI